MRSAGGAANLTEIYKYGRLPPSVNGIAIMSSPPRTGVSALEVIHTEINNIVPAWENETDAGQLPDADPFYGESNLAYLRKSLAALKAGEGIERNLIEVPE